MATKQHSTSSILWLHKHFSDQYVKKKQKMGLRSRAWFKIDEIQRSDKLFRPGMNIIDLGAAPGGWSQYLAMQIGKQGKIIACDILPMDPISGVYFLQGDCRESKWLQSLLNILGEDKVQVVLSDMSPNISGIPAIDIPNCIELLEIALTICRNVLAYGGSFMVKVFQGEGFDEYLCEISYIFKKVNIRKPASSRMRSREVYIVATGYKV